MFQRDESTGRLFWGTTTKLNEEASWGTGDIVGMTISSTKLFVSYAESPTDSRIVVIDFGCGLTPSPTVSPTPAPTLSPSRAPTGEGGTSFENVTECKIETV